MCIEQLCLEVECKLAVFHCLYPAHLRFYLDLGGGRMLKPSQVVPKQNREQTANSTWHGRGKCSQRRHILNNGFDPKSCYLTHRREFSLLPLQTIGPSPGIRKTSQMSWGGREVGGYCGKGLSVKNLYPTLPLAECESNSTIGSNTTLMSIYIAFATCLANSKPLLIHYTILSCLVAK